MYIRNCLLFSTTVNIHLFQLLLVLLLILSLIMWTDCGFLSSHPFHPLFLSDRPSAVTNLTHQARPGSGTGLGRVEWLIPLAVVSALTFFCFVVLLAVLIYWRWVQQQRHLLSLSWRLPEGWLYQIVYLFMVEDGKRQYIITKLGISEILRREKHGECLAAHKHHKCFIVQF